MHHLIKHFKGKTMYSIKKQFNPIFLITLFLVLFTKTHAQTISDQVYKTNITPIDQPLQRILKLEPIVFEYKKDQLYSNDFKNGKQYGFFAKNMQDVFPGMVSTKSISYMYAKNTYRESKIQTIDEVSLIPVLVASIQELHNEIEQLKTAIQALKK